MLEERANDEKLVLSINFSYFFSYIIVNSGKNLQIKNSQSILGKNN